MKKTNAMRELDKAGIDYQYYEYEVDEEHLGAIDVALKTGQDISCVFKTLVLINEKKEMIVACIPGSDTIDLKKLAKVSSSKKVEMIPFLLLEKDAGRDRPKLVAQKSIGKGSERVLRQGSVGLASSGECYIWVAIFHRYQGLCLIPVKLWFPLMSSLALRHQFQPKPAWLS